MWLKIGRGLFSALRVALGAALMFVGYALFTRDVAVMRRVAQWATDPPFGLNWWAIILLALGAATVLHALPSPWRGQRPVAKPPLPESSPPTRTFDTPSPIDRPLGSTRFIRPSSIVETPPPAASDRPQTVEHHPTPVEPPAPDKVSPTLAPHFRSRPQQRPGYRNLRIVREPLNRQ